MKRMLKKITFTFFILACVFVLYAQRPFSQRLGAYTTSLVERSTAQRLNILRSASYLNGQILAVGQNFSFNQSLGPFEASRGFLPEKTYLEHQAVPSAGGGVCQLASTLYQAALQAGLFLEERHAHSRPVLSVPEGQDATVAFGVLDLRFKNPYPFPIQIQAKPSSDQLQVSIWGKEKKHAFPFF